MTLSQPTSLLSREEEKFRFIFDLYDENQLGPILASINTQDLSGFFKFINLTVSKQTSEISHDSTNIAFDEFVTLMQPHSFLLDELLHRFRALDSDKEGSISIGDYKSLMKAFGIVFDDHELAGVADTMNFKEFLNAGFDLKKIEKPMVPPKDNPTQTDQVEVKSKGIDYRIEQQKKQDIPLEVLSSDEEEGCWLCCFCGFCDAFSEEVQDEPETCAVVGTRQKQPKTIRYYATFM